MCWKVTGTFSSNPLACISAEGCALLLYKKLPFPGTTPLMLLRSNCAHGLLTGAGINALFNYVRVTGRQAKYLPPKAVSETTSNGNIPESVINSIG